MALHCPETLAGAAAMVVYGSDKIKTACCRAVHLFSPYTYRFCERKE